jgi:DNA-directed RNA polymerase subunit M/transcription elongation factor TFIIS
MNNCITCSIETTNPKFCTRSCAAIFNNKAKPKRKLERKCSKCENIVDNQRTVLCSLHLREYKSSVQYKEMTIGEYRNINIDKHPSWKHSSIRNFARSWFKHLRDKPCSFCGYDKHVELAHIKAITDFDDSALLKDVNSEDNIIQLCPNCHWEFDNLPRK